MDATAREPARPAAMAEVRASPAAEILRDITRGGLTGLIVGILVAGVGGRLVMRLAALLVPEAAGGLTENGNRIGAITLDGSLALVVFIGLFFGAAIGSVWVVIAPWMPSRPSSRALAAIPVAIALGARGLVSDTNLDFFLLGRSIPVIASLILLVALAGPAVVAVERWLDHHLPHPGARDRGVVGAYAVVALLGTLLTLGLVVPAFIGSDLTVAGVALVVVGLCTLASWWRRIRALDPSPAWLTAAGRGGILIATLTGLAVAVREVRGILG